MPLLDTSRRIGTPEGIELALPVAGPAARALAWLIDLALRMAILIAVMILASFLGRAGGGVALITAFFLEWLFPAWCEVNMNGATPGKKALGLVVLHDDGTPVRWPAAMTRNLLRTVDFLPFLYGFGLLAMLINRDFKRLGDLAAHTIVVYREAKPRAVAVPMAPPLAPPALLALDEQRAVLDFAERSASLTTERAEELAEIASPLLSAGARHESAAQKLIRMANHLIGRK
ncbi:MAG TPA: RDD family protein [Burkholderiales bacterium]|nr:RDD family protein [Burkholderiales bacterium]